MASNISVLWNSLMNTHICAKKVFVFLNHLNVCIISKLLMMQIHQSGTMTFLLVISVTASEIHINMWRLNRPKAAGTIGYMARFGLTYG